jgi:hypothetical protein
MTNYITVADILTELKAAKHLPKASVIAECVDPQEDDSTLVEWLLKNEVIESKQEWKKIKSKCVREAWITKEIGGVPEHSADLVELYAAQIDFKIRVNGCVSKGEDDDTVFSAFVRDVRLENERLNLGFKRENINDSADRFKENSIKKGRALLREALAYNQMDAAYTDSQLALVEQNAFMTPAIPGLYAAVVKHFIHQVKTKMAGRIVATHLMMIITGKQGSGKSSFIGMLTAPVDEVKSVSNFASILDNRNMDIWKSNVIYVEEMEKAAKADMQAVKGAITRTAHNARTMYTNNSDYVKNNAVFVGDGNVGVAMLLNDSTGMRRFIEIPWHDADGLQARKAVWDALNNIDWNRVWRGVDENGPEPIEAFRDQLLIEQANIRKQSYVEQWLRDDERDSNRKLLTRLETDGTTTKQMDAVTWDAGDWKSAGKLYAEHFKPWMENMYPGVHLGSNTFYDMLKQELRDRAVDLGLENTVKSNQQQWRLVVANLSYTVNQQATQVVSGSSTIDYSAVKARLKK